MLQNQTNKNEAISIQRWHTTRPNNKKIRRGLYSKLIFFSFSRFPVIFTKIGTLALHTRSKQHSTRAKGNQKKNKNGAVRPHTPTVLTQLTVTSTPLAEQVKRLHRAPSAGRCSNLTMCARRYTPLQCSLAPGNTCHQISPCGCTRGCRYDK